jgi:uncharacterized protein YbbC (DUF1343 family)
MYVQLGIDILKKQNFKQLHGGRIGLCTNLSCCDSQLIPTYELFKNHTDLKVVFAPEHGLFTALQDQIPMHSYYDHKNRLEIVSLYNGKKLTADTGTLTKIDILVIDLFDIGTRYYTFLWTAMLLMQQASQMHKKIIILDRPNPINGIHVQGPVLLPEFRSFVGLYPLPIRHGTFNHDQYSSPDQGRSGNHQNQELEAFHVLRRYGYVLDNPLTQYAVNIHRACLSGNVFA